MIIDHGRVASALPAYDLGATLGKGAFGLVLQGRHRRLERDVAIKVLAAADDYALASFASEARLLAAMDHPHVVRIYDYVEAGDLCLIIMELLAGGTLTRRRSGMPPEAACAVGLAVAEALSYAHDQGVLHRDIKSDNMLFDHQSLLKVTDFGVAKIFEGTAVSASGVVGTPKYMAPEQITGGRLGPATDIYALGVVLYELLAGTPPFDPTLGVFALYRHQVETTPPAPAGTPAPVADVVMRALAKDPAERQPSARMFALDLARAAARGYGPRWTSRAGVPLRLSDEVREAAERIPHDVTRPLERPRDAPTPGALGAVFPRGVENNVPASPAIPVPPDRPSQPPSRPTPAPAAPPPGRTPAQMAPSAPVAQQNSAGRARRFTGARGLRWTAAGLFGLWTALCLFYISLVPDSFTNDPDADVDFGALWGWVFLAFVIVTFASPVAFGWQVWRLRPVPLSLAAGQPGARRRPDRILWSFDLSHGQSHALHVELPGSREAAALSGDLRIASLPCPVRLLWTLQDGTDGAVLAQGHMPMARGRTDPLRDQPFPPRFIHRLTLVMHAETQPGGPGANARGGSAAVMVAWKWPGVYG